GGREIITLLITSARILHPGIEHGLEEIVPEIVMCLPDPARTALGLAINDKRNGESDKVSEAVGETLLEPGGEGTATHFVKRPAVPPPIHVGFAKSEGAAGEDACKKAFVVHLDIPGTSAVDLNV